MAGPAQTTPLQRRLASVLAADVVGYTRLMELDEQGTHSRLMNLRFDIMQPLLASRQGRIVKNTGDGFMAMFETAHAALQSAKDMQRAVTDAEAGVPADRRIAFRMGVNVADVIVEDHDVYGDGVNIAARLQSHAEPGGIVISGVVAEQVGGTLGMQAIDLGQMHMRNLSHPVRVLSLRFADAPAPTVGETHSGYEARPSIAVLPFRETVSTKDTYFAHGIVDNIIHALAALKELFVISRGSTLGYGGQAIDMRAVGRALGVRYVLYGSVQRAGGRLRITTELGDAETGEVIRTDHYDGHLEELFDLQDRIAGEVVKTIAPHVRDRELKRALRKHPQNMTAYDLMLQALEPLNQLDYATFSRARGLLQRAMIIDPSYAPAFSYAAWWHSYRIGQEWSPDFAMDSGEAARLSAAAIERDGGDALALAIDGHQKSFLKKDFDGAIESFDCALSASPNSAIAWTLKGATYCFIGDGPGAVRCAEAGLRLSPIDQSVFFAEHILGQAHYINGNFEDAVVWSGRADKRNGRLTSNLRTLCASLVATGRIDEAREVAQRHCQIAPNFSLRAWAARTPMSNEIARSRIEKLRAVGMPE
jgi:adenylate cyclase